MNNSPESTTPDDRSAPLEMRDLHISVPDGNDRRVLLDGVDLEIAAGEVVVLTGASGSGKSTLLAVAGLLRRADSGEVRINSQSLQDASERVRTTARRSHIGIIYQSANLLPTLTAREQLEILGHIAGAPKAASRARATALLEEVGVGHRIDALPQHMSGGEQQRVGVARALMAEPSVLLADEPTASLDPELSTEISRLIAQATSEHGLATLLVTHDEAPLAVADRRIHLEAGALHERTITGT